MANLKTLKTRIKSVKSTQKMTKAMKMVAASRLKKAKHAVESSRPYADKIHEMVAELASNIAVRENFNEKFPLLTGKGKAETHLLVIFSSDRGLCGGLNSATVKFAKQRINELVFQGRDVKIFCVGRKAYDQLRSTYGKQVVDHVFGVFRGVVDYKIAQDLAGKITALFDQNQFDICEVIYSKFKSAIAQEQICKQLIPAQISFDKNSARFDPTKDEMPKIKMLFMPLIISLIRMVRNTFF
jgi:F-type H+-transporting ATPase subunit gamma